MVVVVVVVDSNVVARPLPLQNKACAAANCIAARGKHEAFSRRAGVFLRRFMPDALCLNRRALRSA